MKTWAVYNQKGGVAKTTTVVTLGGLLASWGFKTLLVDLDPHGSLTSYFKMNPDELETSVYNLFQDASRKKGLNPDRYISETGFDRLFLLPAATAIATLDRQSRDMDGMGLVISKSLFAVSHQYDYVLIDSPPMLGTLMINALAACEFLIVPVQTEFLALKGLERMFQTLNMIEKSRGLSLSFTIVQTLFDRRTRASIQSLRVLREQYPPYVWDSVIPVDTKIRDASRAGVPASHYVPKSKAVIAYMHLLESILPQTKENTKKVASL